MFFFHLQRRTSKKCDGGMREGWENEGWEGRDGVMETDVRS